MTGNLPGGTAHRSSHGLVSENSVEMVLKSLEIGVFRGDSDFGTIWVHQIIAKSSTLNTPDGYELVVNVHQ